MNENQLATVADCMTRWVRQENRRYMDENGRLHELVGYLQELVRRREREAARYHQANARNMVVIQQCRQERDDYRHSYEELWTFINLVFGEHPYLHQEYAEAMLPLVESEAEDEVTRRLAYDSDSEGSAIEIEELSE